jgi:sugar phosphate isomerase/epimerase
MNARGLVLGLLGFLLAAAVSAAAPAKGKWDVGIRDGYLGGIGAADAWAGAKVIGVTQIEVAPNRKLACPALTDAQDIEYSIATPDERKALMEKCKKEGITICAFCYGHSFDKGQDDTEGIETITKVAEAAKDMGVPVIMVPVPGGKGMADDSFIARGKKFLGALVPVADKYGVQIALENLQLYWNRPEVLLPVLQSLPPDKVGLAHDVTNMYWFGHPVDKLYGFTEQVAPFVRYAHAKNNKYPENEKNVQRTPPGYKYGETAASVREGDIDFRRIMKSYHDAGYRGVITIEDDSLGKRDEAGKKATLIDDVKFLREIIAGLEK